MELENFGCVAMDATDMVNVDGGEVNITLDLTPIVMWILHLFD